MEKQGQVLTETKPALIEFRDSMEKQLNMAEELIGVLRGKLNHIIPNNNNTGISNGKEVPKEPQPECLMDELNHQVRKLS